jgi:hypothetical protein
MLKPPFTFVNNATTPRPAGTEAMMPHLTDVPATLLRLNHPLGWGRC